MASTHRRITKAGTIIYRTIWSETGPNGIRRKRSKNFSRAADARAYAAQKEQEERRGVGDPDKHTCEQFLRRWLATLRDRASFRQPPSPPMPDASAWRFEKSDTCRLRNLGRLTLTMPTHDYASGADEHATTPRPRAR